MLIPIVCNNIPTWDYWRKVLDAASLHQAPDPRSNGSVPHLVEGRTEDTVGSLGGDSEEAVSRLRDREVVGLQVRTIHEFGRFAGDAVVPKVHLELGDQVGSDDGEGGRVGAELGEEGLRLAHDGGGWKGLRGGRRWRRTRSALRGRLGWGVLAHQPVDLKAGHG